MKWMLVGFGFASWYFGVYSHGMNQTRHTVLGPFKAQAACETERGDVADHFKRARLDASIFVSRTCWEGR